MLFNSVEFIIFAGIFFGLYPFLKKFSNIRYLYIISASFIFYGWWDWRYLLLIISSGMIAFIGGYCIFKCPYKRFCLLLAVIGNLGILLTFKYPVWFASNIEFLAYHIMGREINLLGTFPTFIKILPIGLSFYTFQSLSYTIDIYRGEIKPAKNILLFFSYLSMFPKLVAGPIIRAGDVLEQLNKPDRVGSDSFFEGLNLVSRGFFKKVVIADTLSPFVETAFTSNSGEYGCLFWWVVATAFTFQIYCDFSGYSDIAIGLARWMGLNFKCNFNHPYISSSFKEFWSRWHISLSTWFRDYVYIPLGGSRTSLFRSHINMWVTMILSGIWHGAAWTFVVWGALHSLFLSVERLLTKKISNKKGTFKSIGLTLITMVLVLIAWVFFRSATLSQAVGIIVKMFNLLSFSFLDLDSIPTMVFVVTMIIALREMYIFLERKVGFCIKILNSPWSQALTTASLLTICLYYRGIGNNFIYAQF